MAKRPMSGVRRKRWRRPMATLPKPGRIAAVARALKRAMGITPPDPNDCDDGVICQGCGKELDVDNTNGWCGEECWNSRPTK